MTKFFRNIRQSLQNEGKIGRYLKYAFGEIVLVVIGILIALQINNWHTDVINRKQENFYLNKLALNIAQDTTYLNRRIRQLQYSDVKLNQLIKEINDNSLEEFTLDSVGQYLVGVYRFSPQTSTMDNLLSTGKLDLIRNPALVDSLFVYYNDLNNFPNQTNNSNDVYSRETFGPGLIKFQGGVFGLKKSRLSESDKLFLLNSFQVKQYINNSLASLYRNTVTRATNIIEMIHQNIEGHD